MKYCSTRVHACCSHVCMPVVQKLKAMLENGIVESMPAEAGCCPAFICALAKDYKWAFDLSCYKNEILLASILLASFASHLRRTARRLDSCNLEGLNRQRWDFRSECHHLWGNPKQPRSLRATV
eukprot:1147869-Pelagomonas_calceolata.AAC.1